MTIQVHWAHFCEHAFLDAQGRACLSGVTERLSVPILPFRIDRAVIVASISGPVGTSVPMRLRVLSPVGAEVKVAAAPLSVPGYLLVYLKDLPIDSEGRYRFSLAVSDAARDDVALTDLNVLASATQGRPQ